MKELDTPMLRQDSGVYNANTSTSAGQTRKSMSCNPGVRAKLKQLTSNYVRDNSDLGKPIELKGEMLKPIEKKKGKYFKIPSILSKAESNINEDIKKTLEKTFTSGTMDDPSLETPSHLLPKTAYTTNYHGGGAFNFQPKRQDCYNAYEKQA